MLHHLRVALALCTQYRVRRFSPVAEPVANSTFNWEYVSEEDWEALLPEAKQKELCVHNLALREISWDYPLDIIRLLYTRDHRNVRVVSMGGKKSRKYFAREDGRWQERPKDSVLRDLAQQLASFMCDESVLTRKRDVDAGYYEILFEACLKAVQTEEFSEFISWDQGANPLVNQTYQAVPLACQIHRLVKTQLHVEDSKIQKMTMDKQRTAQLKLAERTKVLQQQALTSVPKTLPRIPLRRASILD